MSLNTDHLEMDIAIDWICGDEVMRYKLGEICEIVSGSTPKTSVPEYWDGDIKWITPAELNDDSYIINDSVRKITELGVKKTGLSPFPVGTVILSSRAPIGKVAIAGCEMYCNQGFKNLICSDKINNRYLFWFLKGNTDYLNSLGRGATFKEISKQIVASIEINVPGIKEQEDAVSVLERVSGIMQFRKQELQMLDDLIKARFIEMFGDLKLNPFGWKLQNFEDLTELITDGEHATPRRVSEGIYLLSARNILNHSLQLKDVDYIDQEEYDRIAKRIIPREGDVLISCSGTVGRCCSVPSGLKFQMVRSAALIRFKDCLSPIFAEYMITSDFLQDQINSSKTASSQANLFQGKIAKLKGFVPPKELQIQFVDFVKQVNKSKFAVQKALAETQLLFDSLMQQYFS